MNWPAVIAAIVVPVVIAIVGSMGGLTALYLDARFDAVKREGDARFGTIKVRLDEIKATQDELVDRFLEHHPPTDKLNSGG